VITLYEQERDYEAYCMLDCYRNGSMHWIIASDRKRRTVLDMYIGPDRKRRTVLDLCIGWLWMLRYDTHNRKMDDDRDGKLGSEYGI
jgi:hypothetical protein